MQARTLGLALLLVGATGALADDMKMPANASQREKQAAGVKIVGRASFRAPIFA
jgi:hypothetical protein